MNLHYVVSVLRHHRHRTLVNVLGIGVGIGLFVSINAVSAAYRQAVSLPFRNLGAAMGAGGEGTGGRWHRLHRGRVRAAARPNGSPAATRTGRPAPLLAPRLLRRATSWGAESGSGKFEGF